MPATDPMILSEVEKKMLPAAHAAIEEELTAKQAGRYFKRALVFAALEKSKGVARMAAVRLALTEGMVSVYRHERDPHTKQPIKNESSQ